MMLNLVTVCSILLILGIKKPGRRFRAAGFVLFVVILDDSVQDFLTVCADNTI